MTRVSSPRRRERPRRLVAAVALVVLSTVAALAALVVGSAAALAAALTAVTVTVWVAVVLGHDHLLDERRRHAEERVVQARAFRSLYLERSAEHALFASRMKDRLLGADRLADDLKAILRLAEARADEAEAHARREHARAVAAEGRAAELEAALADRPTDLVDDLAAWEVVKGADAVAELIEWERRSAVPPAQRRPA